MVDRFGGEVVVVGVRLHLRVVGAERLSLGKGFGAVEEGVMFFGALLAADVSWAVGVHVAVLEAGEASLVFEQEVPSFRGGGLLELGALYYSMFLTVEWADELVRCSGLKGGSPGGCLVGVLVGGGLEGM